MNICQKFKESCSYIGSQTCQAIVNTATRINESRVMSIGRSIIGRTLINCVVENTLECAGYYGCADLAAPIGGEVVKFTGLASGSAGLLALTHKCVKAVDRVSFLQMRNKTRRAVKVLCAASGGASVYALNRFGGEILRSVGSNFAYYTVGILGAYYAIKLYGSEEVLVDRERFAASYPFKTIQSMLICEVLDRKGWIPSVFPFNFIVGQFFGSLCYHPIDLVPYINKLFRGEGFEEIRSLDLELLTPEQLQQMLEQTIQAFPLPLGLSAEYLIDRLRQPELNPAINNAQGLGNNLGIVILQKSLNLFYELDKVHPHLLENIDQYYQNQEIGQVNAAAVNRLVDQMVLLRSLSLENATIAKMVLTTDPARNIDLNQLSEKLFMDLRKLEMKVTGVSIIPDSMKAQSKQQIQTLLKWVLRLAPVALLMAPMQNTEARTKTFYCNSIDFITSYYSKRLPGPVLRRMGKFVKHQVKNSPFQP